MSSGDAGDALDRVAREIGGMERYHLPVIKSLQRHHFIYTDNLDDDGLRYRGITKVE